MADKDFVPTDDKTFRDNFGVYVEEISDPDEPYAARYGITTAQQTEATEAENALTAAHDALVNHNQAGIVLQSNYDSAKTGSTKVWRGGAKSIKGNAAYTETDGRVLKIVGKEISTDLEGKAPVLRAVATPQGVEISFVKGPSDGIELYSERGAETSLTPLKRITKSKWLDARANLTPAQEEMRKYAGFFVQNDDEVGLQSAIVSVVAMARL